MDNDMNIIEQAEANAQAMRAEIERLRAAGRELHAWITVNATVIQQEMKSHDEVLNGWEEACRG